MKKQKSCFFVVVMILLILPILMLGGGAGTIAYYRTTGDAEVQLLLREFLKDFEDWSDWYWPWEERPKTHKLPPLLQNLHYYWPELFPGVYRP